MEQDVVGAPIYLEVEKGKEWARARNALETAIQRVDGKKKFILRVDDRKESPTRTAHRAAILVKLLHPKELAQEQTLGHREIMKLLFMGTEFRGKSQQAFFSGVFAEELSPEIRENFGKTHFPGGKGIEKEKDGTFYGGAVCSQSVSRLGDAIENTLLQPRSKNFRDELCRAIVNVDRHSFEQDLRNAEIRMRRSLERKHDFQIKALSEIYRTAVHAGADIQPEELLRETFSGLERDNRSFSEILWDMEILLKAAELAVTLRMYSKFLPEGYEYRMISQRSYKNIVAALEDEEERLKNTFMSNSEEQFYIDYFYLEVRYCLAVLKNELQINSIEGIRLVSLDELPSAEPSFRMPAQGKGLCQK